MVGGSREAQAFLSHQSWNGTQVIVRMRGLPYSCRAEQVVSVCYTIHKHSSFIPHYTEE